MTSAHFKKILILGSGGLRIGQAGEFDYSGSQAIKALKEENIPTVLINPNIATVQTDQGMAHEVYFQPLNIATVSAVIEKEKPDGLLLGFGGQTALNLGLALEDTGLLKSAGVSVLGTSVASIRQTEDRALFKAALNEIQVKTPRSIAAHTKEEALFAALEIGYPVMLRSGFSLGGLGSGQILNEHTLKQRVQQCLAMAPQVLIEEYLGGWKEFEYEIVRDISGQSLVICTMENLDPMGIHTGESIVVAPAQTLTNTEHQLLRSIALKMADRFKIQGECNVQFAVNPKNGDYRVIEMNARLSRSSALASKATGYPLAFVAAKLALGFQLHELRNPMTQSTCAYFEPALDYIVVKIPRWDTSKLKSAERTIGSEMKSVGEVMAIGRSFPEALQKAVGMLNIGASDLSDYLAPIASIPQNIAIPTDQRLFALYAFFKKGGSLEEAHALSYIDLWFLSQIQKIAQFETTITKESLNLALLKTAKQLGFSDKTMGILTQKTEQEIRSLRLQYGIVPWVKQVDTLAGERSTKTRYLYMSYHGNAHDPIDVSLMAEKSNRLLSNSEFCSNSRPLADEERSLLGVNEYHRQTNNEEVGQKVWVRKQSILVLGSGPYSIGSSVEFDWCAVNTVRTLRNLGISTALINSNPETVSTDYDESDRLYFEQLSLERIQDIADFERTTGIIVSVGGQIANNVALPLAQAGYPILGTPPHAIDQAENRERFSDLLVQLGIDQPAWKRVNTLDEAYKFIDQVGYPVLIRPSYILSGAAMNVVYTPEALAYYLKVATQISPDSPVVISQFISEAKELEIDGVAQNGEIVIQAISEHIENAGIHSGDATLVLPPQKLYLETIRRTKRIAAQIVSALAITGPFNIQFIAKNNAIKVIECNLRASRAFPFVSKVTGHNLIRIATEILMGAYKEENYETLELDYVGVKAAQFSYGRLKGANPVAHVEMSSTGEVACLADSLLEAFWNAWLATDQTIKDKTILLSIADNYKARLLPLIQQLDQKGWKIYSTEGTHRFLIQHGIPAYFVHKMSESSEPNIRSLIVKQAASLIVNIPNHRYRDIFIPPEIAMDETDGFLIRRCAIDHNVPLITNPQSALILLEALCVFYDQKPKALSWKQFLNRKTYTEY